MDNFDSYNSSPPPPHGSSEETRVMTMKDWLITLLISAIPCIGLIMMFVWAFGAGNLNRKNYCRAMLIFAAILFVLYLIIAAVFGAAFMTQFSDFSNY